MVTQEHLVAAGNEIIDADGEVLGLLEARPPPPVDDLQEHDLVPGARGPLFKQITLKP